MPNVAYLGDRFILTTPVGPEAEVDREQFLRGGLPVVMSPGTVVEVAKKDGPAMRITSVSSNVSRPPEPAAPSACKRPSGPHP